MRAVSFFKLWIHISPAVRQGNRGIPPDQLQTATSTTGSTRRSLRIPEEEVSAVRWVLGPSREEKLRWRAVVLRRNSYFYPSRSSGEALFRLQLEIPCGS